MNLIIKFYQWTLKMPTVIFKKKDFKGSFIYHMRNYTNNRTAV